MKITGICINKLKQGNNKMNIEQKINEFESRLTPTNLKKVFRYLTQGLEGLQVEMAIWNISTIVYPKKPYSNSVLIHELTEAEEFDKLGFDFSSEKVYSLTEDEKLSLRDERQKKYFEFRQPHLNATIAHYNYLTAIANQRGFNISTGTLIRFHPYTKGFIYPEYDEIVAYDKSLVLKDKEIQDSLSFFQEISNDEPRWKIFHNNKKLNLDSN